MLANSGLSAGSLGDPENWLPSKQVLDLIEETAAAAGRDDFGVLLGEFRSFASLGPVSLLLRHEMTLRTIIGAMIEYRRLLSELLHLRLERHGDHSVLCWSLIPGLRSSQGVNLLATIAYRVLVDGTAVHWHPECVHFRHGQPRDIAAFQRVFSCPIEFNSEFDGLTLKTGSLDLPNDYADAEMAAHARRLLNLLPGVRGEETAVERTRGTIALLIQTGQTDVTDVARCMGLTKRSLQRRLKSEGQSCSGLLNDVRRELAVRYLGNSSHSSSAVAELVGYSSLSAFTRWFVSEFGKPPGEWRQQLKRQERFERAKIREASPFMLSSRNEFSGQGVGQDELHLS
jgi:AraC-like DNA-binding protein